jgi:RNA recognition motif-containing protein
MASSRSIKTQSNPSECLQVGDLSVMQNQQSIFNLFSPFGKLRYVDMKQNVTKQRSFSGYCFVAFYSTAHATAAKQALDGSEQFGRKLRCVQINLFRLELSIKY